MPVNIIFKTDRSGHIKPIKVRITIEDEECVYKIMKYMLKEVTSKYQLFICKTIDQGLIKTIELRYMMITSIWILWRMV